MKRELMAALAVGGMLVGAAAIHPANAIPSPQTQAAQGGIVLPVARGGPRGGGPGIGGRGLRSGGPGIGGRGFGAGRGMVGRGLGRGAPRFSGPRGPRHGAGPWRGGFRGGHHHRHRPGLRAYAPFYGYPYYLYNDYGVDFDDCRWLRRRALTTGSPIWWDRYYACIED